MQYLIKANLNLYTSPELNSLATQAAADRRLTILSKRESSPLQVRLCEDDYPGWLATEDGQFLEESATPYQAPVLSEAEIQHRIVGAIAFTQSAMAVPNL
ncbi:MAG: NlpC/P60 family protein, partial [Phormidesmis sp. CAN_BIN36]|nr:NlpC/P60 family protein [Phormidesmis sp. CAN_BIN36]